MDASAKKKAKNKLDDTSVNIKGIIEGKLVTITMALITIYVLVGVSKSLILRTI